MLLLSPDLTTATPSVLYYTVSQKQVPLFSTITLVLIGFYEFCTFGNRNEYYTIVGFWRGVSPKSNVWGV